MIREKIQEGVLQKKIFMFVFYFFLANSLFGVDFSTAFGVHDVVVRDISTNGKPAHIQDGTSHTFGADVAIYAHHTTASGINLLAKAKVFFDRDVDELDNDHVPVWFDFLLDFDGEVYKLNESNRILWYIYMDNRQNTVSCIEREVRQHIGLGWRFSYKDFFLATNAYSGFYYIEIDDDTPLERGYSRMELDDGEASNVFEIEAGYGFLQDYTLYGKIKRYSANAGFEELESDYELRFGYKASFWQKDATLNLKIRYTQYDFSRFNEGHTLSVLPWDNDTLIEVYYKFPLVF